MSYLLISIAVIVDNTLYKVLYAVTTVDKLALDRLLVALAEYVAVYAADIGDTCNYARAIRVSQSALNAEFIVKTAVYYTVLYKVLAHVL